MPVSDAYRPDPRFAALGPDFGDAVAPAPFGELTLRVRNDRAAATVGLASLTDAEWIEHFGRFRPLPGQPGPIAMRYHGHQFRQYNPDLGDGRGFLAAQMRETAETGGALKQRGSASRASAPSPARLLDLGTKGSGTTPWSRGGDGRLTLKGGVREVLAAAMLEARGVPTSCALSLIETDERLERNDEPSPTRASVLVRLSHSHIRLGTFQRAAFHRRADMIEALIEHVRTLYHPDVAPGDAPGLLTAVVRANARLAAAWVAAGFVHGVLNTDNLNVTGESFDYGPWRFLPRYDPAFTAAYFDQSGLYAFARQPEAVFWALTQFAGCLKLVGDSAAQVQALTDALNGFGPAYIAELRAAFLRRLGVRSLGEAADQRLMDATLALLREGDEAPGQREPGQKELGWEPLFHDWFGGFASSARAVAGPRARLYQGKVFDDFRFALFEHEPHRPERLEHPAFAAADPEDLLIEEVEALWSGIDRDDDWSALHDKLARIEQTRAARS